MIYAKDVVIELVLKEVNNIKLLKETKITFYNDKINKNISILHISDIHYSGINDKNRLDYLYNKLKEYKVDYICITGDLIDSNNIIEKNINKIYITEWLKKLTSISKIIISLGNHDIFTRVNKGLKKYNNREFWKELRNINNLYVLDNTYYSDKDVYIYGYTQSFNYYYRKKQEDKFKMLKEIDELKICSNLSNNKLKICMIHSPIHLKNKEIKEKLDVYDLILCGHMHNGIVPPIIDEIFDNNVGLIAPNKKLFPKMARGIIKDKNLIIISSGIKKINITTNLLIRWANVLFPIGINKIDIVNTKCDVSKTYKYYK